MQCAICQEEKPLQAFSASVLQNRSRKSRQSRCVDCTNPVCTNGVACKTCTVCRDTSCSGGAACAAQIKPLHHLDSTLPRNLEELRSFKCARCAESMQCAICQETKPLQSFSASVVQQQGQVAQVQVCRLHEPSLHQRRSVSDLQGLQRHFMFWRVCVHWSH